MPLIPCPQCHKGVQVLQGSTGQMARCLACGRQFVVQIPGEQPRRTAAATPLATIADNLPMIGILFGAGLLLVGIIGGIGIWFLMPPAPRRAAPPPAALVKAAPDTPISRIAQAGPLSWVPAHPLKAADKDTWKVTAEPIEPPQGLLSVIPLVHQSGAGVVFSGPAAARAGTLQTVANPATRRHDLVWVIYDLRQPLPVASVTTYSDWTVGASEPRPWGVMSQSGKQVAIPKLPGEIRVWSDDGREVVAIAEAGAPWEGRMRRPVFAGDSRLVIDGDPHVTVYELPSGKELYRLPAASDSMAVVSRGGKWLGQVTPKAIHWFSTDDGSPAGTIDFGEHWKLRIEGDVGLRTPGFALHPNGRSLAILALNAEQDLLVAHWDLAKGEPIEQFVVPVLHHKYDLWLDAAWCGERKLLMSKGQVLDLDLKTWTCRYNIYSAPDSPDYRRWASASLTQEQMAAAAQKLGIPPPPAGGALVAGTIPDERIAKRLAAAREGALFHPGLRFAVDADESVPAEYRQTILTGLADALAAGGCVVDPAAKHRARVVEGQCDRTPNLTFDGRKFYRIGAKIQFLDGQGREVLPYQHLGTQAAGRTADAWVALAEEFKAKIQLPRLVLKDAAGKDLEPWGEMLEPGVDGVFAPGELRGSALNP